MSSGILRSHHGHWDLLALRSGHERASGSRHRNLLLGYCTRLVADGVMLNAALVLAYLSRYLWAMMDEPDQLASIRAGELADHYLHMYLDVFWIVTLIGLATFWLSGLYSYARQYRIRYKAFIAAQAVAFAFGLSAIVVYVTGKTMWLPGGVLIIAWALAVVLIVASRVWSEIWRYTLSSENWRSNTLTPRHVIEAATGGSQPSPTVTTPHVGTNASQPSDTARAKYTAGDASERTEAAPGQVQTAQDPSWRSITTTPAPVGGARAATWRSNSAAHERIAAPSEGYATETTRLGRAAADEKTVLVIGGAGYIGSALLPKLLQRGYRVRVLDLFLYGFGPIAKALDDPAVEIVRADFRQIDALVRAMHGAHHVVHLGGIVGDPACAIDEELTIDVNVSATRLVGEVAKGNGVKHFVFASTCSVYGASDDLLTEKSALNPLSLYARSKLASERVLLGMADDTFTPTILRFGTIYGLSGRTRFDLVVNLLAAKAAFEGRFTVFGGDQWRPFLHVDDAALAVVRLLDLPPGRGADVFNVGSNRENYTIGQVGDIVKIVVPEADLTVAPAERDRRNYRVSFSKIQVMAEFEPRWTVEVGVRQVVNAIRVGEVVNYREMRYSNEKYLAEMNGNGLAPPRIQWAHDLIRQLGAPIGVVG